MDTPEGYEADGDTVPWRSFLREATEVLRAAGFASPDSDARRIVEQASGFEGAELALGLSEPATVRGVTAFDAMMARRLAGEPLQYVVGRWGFRTLDLMVDRRVLIPRPETEIVAGVAIDELDRIARMTAHGAGPAHDAGPAPRAASTASAGGAVGPQRSRTRSLLAVDLGTGSGAIGLSIAAERADVHVVLTDASADALTVARANLAGIGSAATRVRVVRGDWFEALPPDIAGAVDVVVSNPPYVGQQDDLPAEVADWEPPSALIAPDSGLAHLRAIVDDARSWLRPGGALVLEMAPTQTEVIAALAAGCGYVDVEIFDDLAGRPRAVRARIG